MGSLGFYLQDGDAQFENVDSGVLEGQTNWETEQLLFQNIISSVLRKISIFEVYLCGCFPIVWAFFSLKAVYMFSYSRGYDSC